MEAKIIFPRGSFDIGAYNQLRVYVPFSLLPSLDQTICPGAFTAGHTAEDVASVLRSALDSVMIAIGREADSSGGWTRVDEDTDYQLDYDADTRRPRAIAFTMERHPSLYVPAFLRRPVWVECAGRLRNGTLECDAYISKVLAV
ncbi:hypothetical protein MMYC01_207605 [Madurella mycetomatis]|uniref:Uncharacterized protein n=1 Tax=Madurella mycetomatis TaxID=100816 RepID=A0A175VZZ3_9PEZI|nr:hypothetical protein MMYC01_207605 [Madurella mycetomatis]